MGYLLKHNLLVGIIFIVLIVLLAIPFINLPHFWDGMIFANTADWMYHNNFNPMLPGAAEYGGIDYAHPPLLFFTLSVAFYLFGPSLWVSHVTLMFFAFLAAYFTYLLGSYLYSKKVGFIASIFLIFSPLFYSQSHILNLDLPLTAFTVMAVYFAIRNKFFLYFLSAGFLVLTKEPGVLTILAITIYVFMKNLKNPKKVLLNKSLCYLSPLLVFIAWVFLHWIFQSQGVLWHSSLWRSITFIVFLRFLNRIRVFFFDDFRWIFTFIIMVFLILNTKKSFYFRKIIIGLGCGVFSLFLFAFILKVLLNNIPLLESIISLAKGAGFNMTGNNLRNLILNLYSYRFIFAIFVSLLVYLLIAGGISSFSTFKNKKFIPIYLTFLFYSLLFSWTYYQPRYSLPLYPFFFIFSTYALTSVLRKKALYAFTIILVGVLVFYWYSPSEITVGYLLEKNIEYKDAIITHKDMTDYIEHNFPEATVLTYGHMVDELRYTNLGYVKNTINPLDYGRYDFDTKKINFALNMFDWYYYKCYLKNECGTENLTHIDNGDIRMYDKRYKEYLVPEDFDLFYYSPQSMYPKSLIKLVEDFNLTLIKKFEKNGKSTELYATQKFLFEHKPDLIFEKN